MEPITKLQSDHKRNMVPLWKDNKLKETTETTAIPNHIIAKKRTKSVLLRNGCDLLYNSNLSIKYIMVPLCEDIVKRARLQSI